MNNVTIRSNREDQKVFGEEIPRFAVCIKVEMLPYFTYDRH